MILHFAKRMDLEVEVTDEMVEKEFTELDTNHDEQLDLEEFSLFVERVYKRLGEATEKRLYELRLEKEDYENYYDKQMEKHDVRVNVPEDEDEAEEIKETLQIAIKDLSLIHI